MTSQKLHPFGVVATSAGDSLESIRPDDVRSMVADHRLLVLRGIKTPSQDEFIAFCARLGTILEWEFGAINELQAREQAPNYLYTNRAVPFHWDGAFVGRIPHFIVFHCQQAPGPGCGGETTFCDTPAVLTRIDSAERREWGRIRITYSTEKVVHYGGTFTSPLLDRHPVHGFDVIRYAEPVHDLNPVRLSVEGLPADQHSRFIDRMKRLLYDPEVCYAHAWETGDLVVADNHALLHGRHAFSQNAVRHLRRINVMEPD